MYKSKAHFSTGDTLNINLSIDTPSNTALLVEAAIQAINSLLVEGFSRKTVVRSRQALGGL